MKLKVCGITKPDQFTWLENNGVDMIGVNFYQQSKRYVERPFYKSLNKTKKVGVFVNASFDAIEDRIEDFQLDMVQLHGDESAEYCAEIAKRIPVIKVFRIDSTFSFDSLDPFLESSTYFLFDTKTHEYGGSGIKFDWQILNNYQYDKPFILSGGISLNDFSEIRKIEHPKLFGIDVNSGFEIGAGIKDMNQIERLIKLLENEES